MTQDASRATLATSFGQATSAYNTGRPTYPAPAVRWMLGDGEAHVVDVADIGAGTGKLTEGLLAPDRTVVAVDPDAAMLASLAERLPGVRTLVGTGEAIPLPDGSLDALTFGQAWHWVDQAAASREAARVLRPGGSLGLIWNLRDPQIAWVNQLTDIMRASAAERHLADGGPTVGPELGPLESFEHRWTRAMTVDDILAMVTSRSHFITAPADEQADILARARALLTSHPDLASSTTITMPYVTTAYRAIKR